MGAGSLRRTGKDCEKGELPVMGENSGNVECCLRADDEPAVSLCVRSREQFNMGELYECLPQAS